MRRWPADYPFLSRDSPSCSIAWGAAFENLKFLYLGKYGHGLTTIALEMEWGNAAGILVVLEIQTECRLLAKAGRDFPRATGNTIPEAIEPATQIHRL